ncbi:MAG: carbohydrate-binding protein [Lachnospiraceae bacterium]|nr:carbohydrate-binding protein [Lachnospiraceae bacterium]
MRNQLRAQIRRGLSIAMATAMIVTALPGQNVFAGGNSPAVYGETDGEIAQIPNLGEPKEEKVAVEVFSQYGDIKNIYMDQEEYEDLYKVEEGKESTYSESKSEESLNIPVAPKWNVAPAPVAGKYNFQYADLVNNGDDSDNYCIILMGDGYTASEQDKFLEVCRRITNQFMNKAPFSDSDIKNHINIRAVCVVSNESGVQENADANGNSLPAKDTFFSTTFFNSGIERLIIAHNSTRVWEIRDQYMQDAKCPIVIGNSTKYGGAGGSYCTISAHNDSPEIAIHEFGHTGGHLADEYWELTTDNRSEAPNRTNNGNASTCKWSDLIGKNGVGLYGYDELKNDHPQQYQMSIGWYRPHQSCEMRYLNQQFCEVCKRQIRSVIKGVSDNAVDKYAIINNANDLKTYVQKVANGGSTAGKTVTLNADINLGGATIPAMGEFKGTFNGNGHTISNFTINSGDGTGFIKTLEGTGVVKDLHLENINVNGGGYHTGGIVGNCKGKITGCSVTGSVRGANAVGGIAGHTESGALVENSYNRASVFSSEQVAGGVVGWAEGGTVRNNYSMGNITSNMSWKGGVSGYATNTTYTNNFWLSGSAAYGAQGGSVSERNATEFSNGTVTNLLNSVSNVWKQGDGYPVHTFSSQNVEPSTQQTTQQQDPTFDAFGVIEAEQFSSNSGGVKDNNPSASGGGNLGGVLNGTSITFNKVNFAEAASSLFLRYSSPSGTASGYVEVYSDGNKVGQITLENNGSNWATYGDAQARLSSQIGAGVHKIMFKFVTTNSKAYVCNLDYVKFIRANGDTTAPAGYNYCTTSADDTWHSAGAWSYYFGEWNGSVGYYKGGTAANDFTVAIAANNKATWGIQIALDNVQVQSGHKYTYTINMTSNAAGSIIHKEDVSREADNTANIVNGNNTISGTFTATDNRAKILLELASGLNAGTEIHVTGFTLTDLTQEQTTADPDGITYKDGTLNDWVTSGDWGLFFGNWDGAASCQYGSSGKIPFAIKVNETNKGVAWLVQASYTKGVTNGHKYRVTANVTLSKNGSVGIKEDLSHYADNPVYTDITANKATNLVAEYDVINDQIKVMFELGTGIDKDTVIKFNSIKIEDITPVETTTETPKPVEVVGLSVSSPQREEIKVGWSMNDVSLNNGQKYNIYIDGNKKQSNLLCGTYTFTGISEGTHTVKVTAVLNGFETNGVQTTVKVDRKLKTIEGGIEFNGFQINSHVSGVRTVYSVDSTINNKEVVESGIVYGLEGYVNDDEMYIGSANKYVYNFSSTSKGKMSYNLSDSDISTTYAMTMMFANKTYRELTAGWKIRAYAKLSDGTYVYSNILGYKIYDIAEALYKEAGMATEEAHNRLYDDIISKVTPEYHRVTHVAPIAY